MSCGDKSHRGVASLAQGEKRKVTNQEAPGHLLGQEGCANQEIHASGLAPACLLGCALASLGSLSCG